MPEDQDVVILQDEDGTEHRFNLVETVEVDRRRYAVLLPEDEEDAAAVIFRMESEDHLVPIEDDQELSRVMAALEETAGYSEVVLEDDEDEVDDDDEDLAPLEELEEYEDDDEDEEDD